LTTSLFLEAFGIRESHRILVFVASLLLLFLGFSLRILLGFPGALREEVDMTVAI
jgi:hypothetical protein